MTDLSALPSVDVLLNEPQVKKLISSYGRSLTLKFIRHHLEIIRQNTSTDLRIPKNDEIIEAIGTDLQAALLPTLQPVINASGVILHTNLGRAPLGLDTLKAMVETSNAYTTLEYDLYKGRRGSRSIHAENLFQQLLGIESALIVNNNAGAVLLTLAALANRKKVIISRTQLVEIGGGFRIPDVMKQSGAKLVEVGTTNRVHLSDYKNELENGAKFILIAHHSNFKVIGFTSEPSIAEIVALAHEYQVPVIHDLGSGALIDTARFGIAHEPMVQESLAAGIDLVCFSGDKLFGGPQAGIIVGNKTYLDKIKKHPLARALRADKLCLAGISATLTNYLKDEAGKQIPIWQMISATPKDIQKRAKHWATYLRFGNVLPGKSTIGGGSLPEEEIDTYVLSIDTDNANKALIRLREQRPPIIARIVADKVLFDPRTVLPHQEAALLRGIEKAINPIRKSQ